MLKEQARELIQQRWRDLPDNEKYRDHSSLALQLMSGVTFICGGSHYQHISSWIARLQRENPRQLQH